MAHLMCRAGFGAPREELEERVAKGYEATVEELLHPEDCQLADEYLLGRYLPQGSVQLGGNALVGAIWHMWHMINSERLLEEKMTLFWHQLFATSMAKVGNYDEIAAQITLFRDLALGDFKGMLNAVAKNPAMIYWLDNQENHNYAVNENSGRELLELFSIGVGNYTEVDVREASRAFTGWALGAKFPVEGWHTGKEWIDSGSLMNRVNFASELVGGLSRPGVQDIVGRVREHGTLEPEQFVEVCLDLIGPLDVRSETRERADGARPGGWNSEVGYREGCRSLCPEGSGHAAAHRQHQRLPVRLKQEPAVLHAHRRVGTLADQLVFPTDPREAKICRR